MSHALKTEGAFTFAPSKCRHAGKIRWRSCNICADEFQSRTPFDRFCPTCKEECELLRFSDWLPELDAAITERVSA